MPFFARHIPGLATALSLVLCSVLIVLGHKDDFDQKLATSPVSYNTTSIAPIVIAYHNRSRNPSLIHSLSATLAHNQPIRRLAFAILFQFTPPQKRVQAYLHHTPFGQVSGIKRAALYYFGVHHSKLTAGEMLLLCELAQGADLPINDPIAALHRRDALLTDLHNRGVLPSTTYHIERKRALSLSADHRPVN